VTKFDPKSTTRRTVVHEKAAADTGLSAEEERVLRLRAGAGVPDDAPLGSKLDGVPEGARADLAARLRLLEAAVLEQMGRGPSRVANDGGNGNHDAAVDTSRKARIVSALKKLPPESED
jgi:hypothetical protein